MHVEELDRGTAAMVGDDDRLDHRSLRDLCLAFGADDAGIISIDAPALGAERAHLLATYPKTRTVIGFVVRCNPDNLRSPQRSLANVEFHRTGEAVEHTARAVLRELRKVGVSGLYPSMGFPMEMDRIPGRIWAVSHKTVAEATGMGKMGLHRIVIHPKLGNHVLLGSLLIDRDVDRYDRPIDFDPCMNCRLCVAACPVGAISADGSFSLSACANHNYREFMGGFTRFTETIADAKNARDLRRQVRDTESASWWQSLSFGANYKAAYCMAVCPAGDDVIGVYNADKAAYKRDVLKPLTDKVEDIYVIRHSDAEAHVRKRFPHKHPRFARSLFRPSSVAGFLRTLPVAFNRDQSKGLDAVYHMRFSGAETAEATVTIRDRTITVRPGLHEKADFVLAADAAAWLGYLRRDRGLIGAVLGRKIRIKGNPKLLKAFARCFPS